MHEAAQFVTIERRTTTALAGIAPRELLPGLRQLQQIVDRHHQLAVVPRFGEVIGGAGLDQLHRRFQMRPRGQQNHRKIRMLRADLAEQRFAFFTRRGVGIEVHVLHHQVHRRLRERRQPFDGTAGDTGVDIVQREQGLERGGDRRIVVDDENGGHAQESAV